MKRAVPLILFSVLVVIAFAETRVTPQTQSFIGGVVPHHDLVMKEIERFWQELDARTDPDLIILVGPDHENQGRSIFTTTSAGRKFTDGSIAVDDAVFANEHSISIHTPFIAQYFPDASTLPILIRSDARTEDVLTLAQSIRSTTIHTNVAIIASVDFSHYKTLGEAEAFDIESIAAVKTYDFGTLSTFGSEHMDSDQSIILMSEAVCPEHTCTWEELFHGNSSDEQFQSPTFTTSYYSLFLAAQPLEKVQN